MRYLLLGFVMLCGCQSSQPLPYGQRPIDVCDLQELMTIYKNEENCREDIEKLLEDYPITNLERDLFFIERHYKWKKD